MDVKKIALSLLLFVGSVSAQTTEFDEPPPRPSKTYSWKANAFVGSAFLAVVTGIVIICLDGGTPNKTIEANVDKHDHKHHRHDHDDWRNRRYESIENNEGYL